MQSRGRSETATITRAWISQDGVLMAVLDGIGPVVLPRYDGDPDSLCGRRVKLVDGRWLLEGRAA